MPSSSPTLSRLLVLAALSLLPLGLALSLRGEAVFTAASLGVTVVACGLALALGIGLYRIERTSFLAAAHALRDQVRTVAVDPPAHRMIGKDGGLVDDVLQSVNQLIARWHATFDDAQAERDRLSAVLRTMADGVIIVDRDERVLLANDAARRILDVRLTPSRPGVGSAAYDGPTLIELTRDHQFQEILAAAENQRGSRVELIRCRPTGRYVRVTAAPLGDAGDFAWLLIIQDVSELRRAEVVRREFIANVSHELNTPIASIKALVETLEDGALEDESVARDFLNRVHVEVDALAQLVRELIELSRIESGQTSLDVQPTQPSDLVEHVVERLQNQAQRSGLTLQGLVPEDLPLVRADRERLKIVFTNLLHNAIKFTPVGGTISVIAAHLPDEPDVVVFRVRDTGLGIPSSDLPRIFERFYKVDKSRSSSGTGLGLAVAKHIVQAHGGRIWVESVEEEGSTFSFTVPIDGDIRGDTFGVAS